jgi:hypothetical protein
LSLFRKIASSFSIQVIASLDFLIVIILGVRYYVVVTVDKMIILIFYDALSLSLSIINIYKYNKNIPKSNKKTKSIQTADVILINWPSLIVWSNRYIGSRPTSVVKQPLVRHDSRMPL